MCFLCVWKEKLKNSMHQIRSVWFSRMNSWCQDYIFLHLLFLYWFFNRCRKLIIRISIRLRKLIFYYVLLIWIIRLFFHTWSLFSYFIIYVCRIFFVFFLFLCFFLFNCWNFWFFYYSFIVFKCPVWLDFIELT